jgi:threonine/homoserine/homoserine lactone efflux protein
MAFVWSSVPGAALAVECAAGAISETVAMALFALSFVGLNLMHMGATWARVYVRPGWRDRPLERLAVPIGLGVFALCYEAVGGGANLLTAQYFFSFHHAIMQNYGLVRASQRRSRRDVDPRLDMAACLLLPGAALLYRAGRVSESFSGTLLPTFPTALIHVMAIAGGAALLALAWREWRAHRNGERIDPIGPGIVFGTNLLWSGMLVSLSHPATPLYALASGHYAQYLYFVWHVQERDPAEAPSPGIGARLRRELRSSRLRYLVGLLALAGGVTLVLTFVVGGLRAAAGAMMWRPADALDMAPWAAAMLGINLEHYWLDHRIWRTSRQPRAAALAS